MEASLGALTLPGPGGPGEASSGGAETPREAEGPSQVDVATTCPC